MSKLFRLKIVTPDGVVYSDDIDQATVPTKAGEITVLAHHTPIVSVLKPGPLVVKKGEQFVHLAVAKGFLEFRPDNQLVIVSSTAERAENIDMERARERAEKLLKEQDNKESTEFAGFQAVIDRDLARIKAVDLYRKRNGGR